MNELAKKLSEDRDNHILIQSIESDIDKELNKPFKERDFTLIDELMTVLYEIKGIELGPPPIEEIWAKNFEKSAKHRKIAFKRCAIFVSAIVMGILGLNTFSEKTYGTNALGAFVEIVSGRMSFNYTKKDIIELPIMDSDPYGLKAECEKHGINSLLPSYIPKNFKLIYSDITETTTTIIANFTYKNSNQNIDIFIIQYLDNISNNFQSSNDGIYSEIVINQILMSIVEDNNEYRVVFNYENTIYNINTQNIDYDVLIGVLYSFQ